MVNVFNEFNVDERSLYANQCVMFEPGQKTIRKTFAEQLFVFFIYNALVFHWHT